MKYKITNKMFSTIVLYGMNDIPARKSIIVDSVPKGLRSMEKKNKVSIKEIKEK